MLTGNDRVIVILPLVGTGGQPLFWSTESVQAVCLGNMSCKRHTRALRCCASVLDDCALERWLRDVLRCGGVGCSHAWHITPISLGVWGAVQVSRLRHDDER